MQNSLIRGLLRKVKYLGTKDVPWSRVVMNDHTSALVESISPSSLDVLEISGNKWKDTGFQSYQEAHFPDFDVCERPLQKTFDLVIAEQVFEHLLWPYRAGKNVCSMVRPGGYFLISTPFLYKVHNWPVDCSRWTELGMKHFLTECGFDFESIQTGSWGNKACAKAFMNGIVPYRPGFHSLKNDPEFPVVVWALAKKGEEQEARS